MCSCAIKFKIGGLLQKKGNSIANALELRLYCTNLPICYTSFSFAS